MPHSIFTNMLWTPLHLLYLHQNLAFLRIISINLPIETAFSFVAFRSSSLERSRCHLCSSWLYIDTAPLSPWKCQLESNIIIYHSSVNDSAFFSTFLNSSFWIHSCTLQSYSCLNSWTYEHTSRSSCPHPGLSVPCTFLFSSPLIMLAILPHLPQPLITIIALKPRHYK